MIKLRCLFGHDKVRFDPISYKCTRCGKRFPVTNRELLQVAASWMAEDIKARKCEE
jgi:DNA-directed RNA polymerase subunit RPC12/RpoP